MAGIGPNLRPTALIFQNRALFPLITVWENIAFSLEVRGACKAELAKDRELRRQTREAPGTEQYKSIFDPSNLQQPRPDQEG